MTRKPEPRTPKQQAADAARKAGYGWQAIIYRPDDIGASSRAQAQEVLDRLGPDWIVQEAVDPEMGLWLIRVPEDLGDRMMRNRRGTSRRVKGGWRVDIEWP